MNKVVKHHVKILKYNGKSIVETEDCVAIESPITLIVDEEEFATIVCTPDNIKELVVGFLASEGIIRIFEDIASIHIDDGLGFAYVQLKVKHNISKDFYAKRIIGSCCGKSRQFYFHNDAKTAKTIMSKQQITVSECFLLMQLMQNDSEDFQKTGGVHNAALCTTNKLLFSYSDIGRHNALDKIYGHCLMANVRLKDKVIVFSGRVSSEVVLKIAKIGVGIVISKSAPTTLGIDIAHDLGITVVGFVRRNQLNIYSHPNRIIH